MGIEELLSAAVLAAACLPLILAALRGKSRGVRRGVVAVWLVVPFAAFAVVKSHH